MTHFGGSVRQVHRSSEQACLPHCIENCLKWKKDYRLCYFLVGVG